VESLPLAFSSGWASGVNAYLVVLVLGVADRISDRSDIPDVLGRWDVLAVAGFLYAMEFVADKIPYVDSTWDVVSTLIRPTAGAVIGAMLAGTVPDDARLDQLVLAAVGGGTALVSHLTKTGIRLAVNTSPEPASNVLASVLEDLAVLGVVAFAVGHPRLAAAIAALLLAAGLVLLFVLARLVRRGWRRWRARRAPVAAP
jgi:hypothetical protein